MNQAVFPAPDAFLKLTQYAKGSKLVVKSITSQPLFGSQDEKVSLRLKELGFLPGAEVEVIGFGLFGADPLAVKVNGTKFALRRAEADKIGVEILSTGRD